MNDPIFLIPYISHTVWGGTRLKEEFGVTADGSDIGECWGVSAHPAGESVVREGEFAGKRLSELWFGERELFARSGLRFRRINDPFPLLIKLIDAHEDLSIQVHPDDEYARIHENGQSGKSECWYVLDAAPGAKIILGHNAKHREDLNRMIDGGAWEELVSEVKVFPGDVIPIAPGTIHAIGAGVLLLEAQQSSDLTYRVYDYDRVCDGEKRQLHTDKAKDVISVPDKDAKVRIVHMGMSDDADAKRKEFLADCGYFTMDRIVVRGEARMKNLTEVFQALCVVEGSGEIRRAGDKGKHPLKKGDFFIVPIESGVLTFHGDMMIIATQPG